MIKRTLLALPSKHLGNTRAVELFVPSGHMAANGHAFRLLILNDGQESDALNLSATLAVLHAERRVAPLAVAAVHATSERMAEYGTTGISNGFGQGARADAYAAFVCMELLPALEQRLNLRGGPQHTAIAGLSLGGLMAFDLAWTRPELFGTVGVFSGSFWWRTDNGSVRARVASRIAHRKVRSTPTLPQIRAWLQAGTADEESDRDGDGVIDAVQDTRELIDALSERGYRRGRDILYREVPDGRHDCATWATVMPEFLEWAFPLE